MKRNIKDIGLDLFKNDTINCLSISQDSNIETAVHEYNTKLKGVIDDHVPLQTKSVKIRRYTKWFNNLIRSATLISQVIVTSLTR